MSTQLTIRPGRISSGTGGGSAAPSGPASGDLGGTYPGPDVIALQGNPVSSVNPTDGQVLTWNGSAWVPGAVASGGSGGGGQTWFLNAGSAGGAPITGLPLGVKDLDLTAEVGISTITSAALPTGGAYAFVAGFVTDLGEPGLTTIPAGIWDFNIWAQSSAPQPNTTSFRAKIYTYDGTVATLIATGTPTSLYDPSSLIQYIVSVLVPQTAILVTDRIYVTIEGTATSAGHTLTLSFGGITPSHTHTTLPSVAGTGIVHVINGVVQSPASPVDLTAGATEISGTLPVINGGTGTSTAPANGELLIGNGVGYTLATLTDGANISITEGAGSITINAVPAGAANEIQLNSGGSAFGSDPNLTFDGVNLTIATGGSAIDIGQGFITGGPNLTVETMLGGTLNLGNGDVIDLVAAQEIRVNGTSGTAGEVLTSNGIGVPATWQALPTYIGGTIAANEVAFGTGVDSIGGSPSLTWNAGTQTLSVLDASVTDSLDISVAAGDVVNVSSTIPVRFNREVQSVNATGFVALDGAGLQSGYGPRDITLADYTATPTTPKLSAFPSLNLETGGEIQINGAAGNAGEVLTSNGAGVAPTWQASSGGINELTGDVTAGPGTGSQAATLAAIRGNAVANVAPTSGQVLTWNGTAWVPAPAPIGGSGAGIPYYLNQNTAPAAPTAGITNPATTTVKQLGTTADVPGTSVTSGILSQVSYDLVANFVSDVGDPNETSIPAGLWTFNIWASSNANQASQTILQIQVGKYDGVNPPTIIATSNDVSIYDPSVTAQYIINVVIPAGTTLLATDRLYVAIRSKATAANRTVTVNFGDGFPSYVVSTFQASSGTTSTAQTDNYYVDAVLGDDLTADGSISKPYKTIQACLTAIGNPTSKQEACRKITVNIGQARSSQPGLIASQANDFNGIYEENLWVPSRMITFVGPGVKIGNNADNTGFGNITQEISTARRFGATSSEVRHTLSFVGRANTRDTHQRIRNGIHIGGITRISCVSRNIGTIQGDSVGGTRVTITLAGGQNPYGVPVSSYASLAVTLTDAGDVIGYTSPTGVAIANSTSANQMIFFKSIVGTTGPVVDTYYYVVNATLTTFQISNSIGGAPIALTTNGTGVVMAKPGYPPFEDLARIKVAGTTNYGTTASTIAYDIIEKLTDTSFIAKRVTGTNTSAAVESTGTITETDSTGSSTTITHDMSFNQCYQQGLVVHDDGVVYSGAPAVGSGGALYARDSRFNAGFLATGVTVQRWENSQAVTTVNSGATVTSFSRTTNVVTVVTSSTCQWVTGQVITIANSTSGAQNIDGNWTILAGGTNAFTLSQTGADYGSQTPSVSSSITAVSMWSTIVTMAQATFTGAGIQLGGTPFTLSTDDAGVSNTRFGVTRLYTTTTSAMPLARIDAYTSHWLYAGGAYLSFPVTFTDAGDIVTRTNHGFSNGSVIRFSGIVNTTGISVNTDYFVVAATTNTFQLALTPGGSAIALTTNGTGTLDVLPTYYPAFLDTYVPTQLFTGNTWVQTSSVTAANTITETNLTGAGVGMLNLPANFLKIGRNLRITGTGYFSCTASTPTLRLQIKLGAVIIADTTAITMPVADSNKAFAFDVNASVRSTGAAGTILANGTMTRMATTLAVVPMNVLSGGVPTTSTVNTTTSQLFTITATWSAADPSNTITLTNLVVSA